MKNSFKFVLELWFGRYCDRKKDTFIVLLIFLQKNHPALKGTMEWHPLNANNERWWSVISEVIPPAYHSKSRYIGLILTQNIISDVLNSYFEIENLIV